jgi:hypothetical protein
VETLSPFTSPNSCLASPAADTHMRTKLSWRRPLTPRRCLRPWQTTPFTKLTLWSWALLEKLPVGHFIETKGSLSCSHEPSTGLYHVPDHSRPNYPHPFSLRSILAYFPYLKEIKVSLCNHVPLCVCMYIQLLNSSTNLYKTSYVYCHISVTIDWVWIGEWICWPIVHTTRNYK